MSAHVLLVTSTSGGAGRTTVARTLAARIADRGRRTISLHADVGALSDGSVDLGLREAATSELPEGALVRVGPRDLDDTTWALHGRDVWPRLVERLGLRADVIVIDGPPIGAAAPMLALVDGVLLLVPLDRPAPRGLERVVEVVQRHGGPRTLLEGIALTRVEVGRPETGARIDELARMAPARAFLDPFLPQDEDGGALAASIARLGDRLLGRMPVPKIARPSAPPSFAPSAGLELAS